MNDDELDRMADKITTLSTIILDTALHLESIIDALKTTQEHLGYMAETLRDLTLGLPPELLEKLKLKAESSDYKNSKNALRDYLRKLLENRGEDSQ